MSETISDLGWWVIHGGDMLDLLRRAHEGENPDVLYAEAYATSASVKSVEYVPAPSAKRSLWWRWLVAK